VIRRDFEQIAVEIAAVHGRHRTESTVAFNRAGLDRDTLCAQLFDGLAGRRRPRGFGIELVSALVEIDFPATEMERPSALCFDSLEAQNTDVNVAGRGDIRNG
jgi:hypothetical protein